MRKLILFLLVFFCLGLTIGWAADVVPSSIEQPGTQPQEVGNLESPNKCDNCHGGYNTATEPAFNWRGSMMANAGRDPIFWATVAVAEQDFDGAGDLCIRCHSTSGWLAGRSTPTDGSGLAAGDSDGVDCDFCHMMTNPDQSEHLGVQNIPFIANDTTEGYYGSGMSVMWGGSEKLGPYSDADARHRFMTSKFHRSVDFCGTCHDVSNPAVGNIAHNFGAQAEFLATESVTADGSPNEDPNNYINKAAFNNPPYKYGVVERTFSEYKAGLISQTPVDDYLNLPADLQGGALEAIYNSAWNDVTQTANYEDGDVRYFSCQSCHLRPVFGQGCNKNPPFRNDLPLHDMTGGNYWMPEAIKFLDDQGKLRLGGGLNATQLAALDAGALRAKEQLNLAATLDIDNNAHTVKIINHTGHKLISGYPEGRRMWLRTTWYDQADQVVRIDGDYGEIGVSINGQAVRSIKNLNDPNTKIYEAHYGMDQGWAAQLISLADGNGNPVYDPNLAISYDRLTGAVAHTLGELAAEPGGTEYESFHFVLNNVVHKDNRIPPYGMTYEAARLRNALPVPSSQYGGGQNNPYDYFDVVALNPPQGTNSATIELLYQPTSWEYIQFLDLANNQEPGAFLENEGTFMLEAWLGTGMAEPYVMASATWGTAPQCQSSTPTLLSATPGNGDVSLEWSPETGIVNYNVYYDQAGKAQLVADAGLSTLYLDSGLTNAQEYCYKITTVSEDQNDPAVTCESVFSNIICAIPNNQGQADVGATLSTGRYETSGKGKKRVTVFVETAAFAAGDPITVRALVTDQATGLPVQNATVALSITGPEAVALVTGVSDANGIAEALWETSAPNKRGQGGTSTGSYSATTTNVSAAGYSWDGSMTTTTFIIQ